MGDRALRGPSFCGGIRIATGLGSETDDDDALKHDDDEEEGEQEEEVVVVVVEKDDKDEDDGEMRSDERNTQMQSSPAMRVVSLKAWMA